MFIKFLRSLFLFLTFFCVPEIRAQLSGTVTVPGTYASISAALVDINTQGVNGSLYVQVAAGYTETVPVGGFSLTATGTSLNPIFFQKSGAGANPLISAFTGGTGTPGSAVQDGIWRFIGSDYVTVDGFDLIDSNTSNPSTMEYGFGFFKASIANGCQNNTISNCNITLKTVNNATGSGPAVDGSRGINVVNALATAQTSNLTPSAQSGANSSNVFLGNVISGCNIGIALIGYQSASPFTLSDTDNSVGGPLAANGNTIINFGGAAGATNPAAAVRTLAQYNLVVSNNYINNDTGSGAAHPTTLRGIFVNTAQSAAVTITGNTLTLAGAGTTQTVAAIENLAGATPASNTITIKNNLVASCVYTSNTTGGFLGITNNAATASGLLMCDNTFSNIVTSSTNGSNYMLYNSGAITGPVTMTGNAVVSCSNISTGSGNYYSIFNNAAVAGVLALNNNSFVANYSQQNTGVIHHIYNTAAVNGSINASNNLLSSLTVSATSSGFTALVYNNSASTPSLAMSGNTVTGLTAGNTSGALHFLYNRGSLTNTFVSVQIDNNYISTSTLSSTSNGGMYQVWNNGVTATVLSVSNNTISQLSWLTAVNQRYIISNTGVNASAAINGNLITSCSSTLNSTGQLQCIYNNNPNSVSGGTLVISQNTLSALNFSSSTGDIYLLHSQGVITNTFQLVQISDNLIATQNQTVSSTGVQYGIYNNIASSSDLRILRNSISNGTFVSAGGAQYHIYNRGQAGSVYGITTVTGNVIASVQHLSSGNGSFYSVLNNGAATSVNNQVDISSNTFTGNVYSGTTNPVNVIINSTPVSGDVSISNNLLTQLTNTNNTTGNFTAVQNAGIITGNLTISSNTLSGFLSTATSASRFHIYNSGAVSGTASISGNLVTGSNHTSTSSGVLYHVINGSTSGGTVSVANNTVTANSGSLLTGAAYMIYNSAAASNTISAVSVTGNLLSNLSYSASSGSYFGIYSNLMTVPVLSVNGNTLTGISLPPATNVKMLISSNTTVPGTLSIGSNLVSNITATNNTTGPFYPVYNSGAVSGLLSINTNTVSNILLSATSASAFGIHNTGVASNSLQLINNTVEQYTFNASTSGVFSGIQNNATSSVFASISQNTVNSCVLTMSTGATQLISNRGAAASFINNLGITSNVISNIIHNAASGSITAVMNFGTSSGTLTINSNTVLAVAVNSTASPRVFVYNTASVTTLADLSANSVSQVSGILGASLLNAAVMNAGNSASDIQMVANRVSSYTLSTGVSTVSLINNSGSAASVAAVSSNSVSLIQCNISGTPSFNGITNTSINGGTVNMAGNILSSLNISSTGSVILLACSRTASNSSQVNFLANKISSVQVSGAPVLYAIVNAAASCQDVSLNSNTISANNFSVTGGPSVLIFNSSSLNGSVLISGNVVSTNSINLSGSGKQFVFNNSGQCNDLAVVNNSINSNVSSGNLETVQYIVNSGSVSTNASFTNNIIQNNTLPSPGSGNLNYLYNTGDAGGNLNFDGNTITNNNSAVYSGTVSFIENNGAAPELISFQNNQLSQIFSTTTNGFAGDLIGILNNNGIAGSSLSVANNSFTGLTFNSGAAGDLGFIRSNFNHSVITISNNIWPTLNLNHDGTETFIYSESPTASLTVSGNSLTGSYNRTGIAGTIYFYQSGLSYSTAAVQMISANSFTGLNASNAGSGSFYGIYSKDAALTKTISNNRISNINYNGSGFMYVISADKLGNDTSLNASAISGNTISGINWQGPFYGIEAGPSISSTVAAQIIANAITSCTVNAGVQGMQGVYVTSSGAGVKISRNKIAGLRESSGMGVLHGLNVNNTSTVEIVNNTVGDLLTPLSIQQEAINALRVQGSSLAKIYYNTVYLASALTGTNTGSNAMHISESVNLDLRNNIIVNNSTPAGNGRCVALRRTGPSLTTFITASDKNIYYAGQPSAGRYIYYDGVTSHTLIGTYQSNVSPREQNSIYDSPVFLSLVPASSTYLHIDPAVNSLAESNAQAIAGYSTDIDLDVRQSFPGYAGTGTAPDIGADEFEQNLIACNSASAGTIAVAGGSVVCEGQGFYLYSTGFSTNGNIQHQWKVATNFSGPYLNVVNGNGTTRTGLTAAPLTQGTYYFVLITTCTTGNQVNASNVATVLVNPAPGATAVVTPTSLCAGQSLTLNANASAGSAYSWNGPVNYSTAVQNPVISSASFSTAGVYTLNTSKQGCSSQATVAVNVGVSPPAFSLTPSSPSICAGSSQTITASVPLTTPTLNFGFQTSQNALNAYPAPYSAYYGGQKMQFLVLANELNSSGFTVGTPITGISFPVVSLGTGWGSSIQQCQNFMISMKTTTVANLLTFENNLTVVYSTAGYTPVTGYNNTHLFQNAFVWDGVSNVVIETVFSNSIIGSPATAVVQNNSGTGFQSTLVYRADNQDFNSVAAATSSNVNVGYVRPDFRLTGLQVGNYSWPQSAFLTTISAVQAVVNPTVNTIFTASLNNAACASSSSFTINVFNIPQVTVSAVSNTVCAGNSTTLSALGAPGYSWSTGSVQSSVIVTPQSSNVYSVQGINGICPNGTATIAIAMLPPLSVTVSASPSVICSGQSTTLNAVGAQTYSWTGGQQGASITVSLAVSSNFSVTASTGSGCQVTKGVNVKVNALPNVVLSVSAPTVCEKSEVKITAAGAATYTWVNGGQTGNSILVYPLSTTNYTVFGKDLNNCINSATVNVVTDACTGLKETVDAGEINIFPNPNTGVFGISMPATGYTIIEIFDDLGKSVLLLHTGENYLSVDLSDRAKGLYLLKIDSGRSLSWKKVSVQ